MKKSASRVYWLIAVLGVGWVLELAFVEKDPLLRTAPTAERPVENGDSARALSEAMQQNAVDEAIAAHRVFVGMSASDVVQSWGRPQKINTTTTDASIHEQWVYGGRRYVYLTDGKVRSIQESR